MRKDMRTALFLIGMAVGVVGLENQITLAQEGNKPPPPPPPAWLDAKGRLNAKLAPKEMAIVGQDGKLVKAAGGANKMAPSFFTQVPPAPPRAPSGMPRRG